jgi:hypothetical protein
MKLIAMMILVLTITSAKAIAEVRVEYEAFTSNYPSQTVADLCQSALYLEWAANDFDGPTLDYMYDESAKISYMAAKVSGKLTGDYEIDSRYCW